MVSKASDGLSESSQCSNSHSDVQSYLISKYREALKKGDKSAAKSCLLAARYFSVNDPNVTNEIYMMAKSDGDVSEASKCFTNIFNDLFSSSNQNQPSNQTNDLRSSEVNIQIKEEIRQLINDLKAQYLKLKSSSTPGAGGMRQAHSVSQSPMLSPRLRLSSEDRAASRESLSKLDSHLHSKTSSIFYQQLFDNLTRDVRVNILDHAIDTCESPLEKCRLMMLSISIFSDNVLKYGPQLIGTLSDLSQPEVAIKKKLLTSCPPMISHYAKSLLILDAIPLIFSTPESSSQDYEIADLLHKIFSYYCEYYLENVASEYEFDELHDGLKKTIAARILGKDQSNSTPDDSMEDNLITILNLLFEKYLNTFKDEPEVTNQLKELRNLIADKSRQQTTSDEIIEISKRFDFKGVPMSFVEHPNREKLNNTNSNTSDVKTATPPPKGRGRPKKSQPTVIVSVDSETTKKHYSQACQANFIFYSILQHMLINCAKYLRQTKSRIVLKFDNPLATLIETELTSKTSSQRSSRSKHQTADSSSGTPSKKAKLDMSPAAKSAAMSSLSCLQKDSPLNSEHSKLMDQAIIATLSEAHKCVQFLKSDPWSSTALEPLWTSFLDGLASLNWYNRVLVDSMIMTSQHEEAVEILDKIVHEITKDEPLIKEGHLDAGTSTLTITPGLPPVGVVHLRALTQLISCRIQLTDRHEAFKCIDELLSKIKQAGLLTNDESYSTGNIIDEYMIIVPLSDSDKLQRLNFGFLFFDALSVIRYAVNISMDILRRHMVSPSSTSDLVVGHLIVLSQFDWPKESQIYEQSLEWLRSNKPKSTTPQCLSASTKFTYAEFFHYIFNPNIVEDFMAMLNQGYTLDIKSLQASGVMHSPRASQQLSQSRGGSSGSGSSERGGGGGTSTRSGKAITTRGVNKTFKEDLKVALVGKMKQSTLLMPLDLITEFIQSCLLPFLAKGSSG